MPVAVFVAVAVLLLTVEPHWTRDLLHRWEPLGTWLVALGTLSLAFVTFRLAVDARKAIEVPAVMELLREYRSEGMRLARDRIRTQLDRPKAQSHAPLGMAGLVGQQREDAEMVAHYLDYLGLLVWSEYVRLEPFERYLGGSAQHMWRILGPFIEAEREMRGPTYQMFFEDLVQRFPVLPDLEVA